MSELTAGSCAAFTRCADLEPDVTPITIASHGLMRSDLRLETEVCSGVAEAAPGTAVGMQLVVDDADQARADLLGAGVTVDDVQSLPWGRFVFFADPDGNRWSVQEVPDRG